MSHGKSIGMSHHQTLVRSIFDLNLTEDILVELEKKGKE